MNEFFDDIAKQNKERERLIEWMQQAPTLVEFNKRKQIAESEMKDFVNTQVKKYIDPTDK